jgi:hypothetical protein
MHEYQTIWPVSFWVHHNVSTLKDRTNRNTRTSIKQASKQGEFSKLLNPKKKVKEVPNRGTQENSKQTNKTKTKNKKPNQEKQNDLLTWVSAHLVRPSW